MSMRWEDERYIRWYTRNTPQWRAMSWRARGLFGLIMREVDRAGILDLGTLGPKGVAVAVEAPWVEIQAPFAELLENGCCVLAGTNLLVPNFLAAQEANQTDRARKQKSRELARSLAQITVVAVRDTTASQDVTGLGHAAGPNVTPGHAASHAVTPSSAVPSLALPSRAEEEPMSGKPDSEVTSSDTDPEAGSALARPAGAVDRVFAVYLAHHPRAALDAKRRALIIRALKMQPEGMCIAAIEGNHVDPHCCGSNERNKEYHDLGLCLRDDDHIVRYAKTWDEHRGIAAQVTRKAPNRPVVCPKCGGPFHLGACASLAVPPPPEALAAMARLTGKATLQ